MAVCPIAAQRTATTDEKHLDKSQWYGLRWAIRRFVKNDSKRMGKLVTSFIDEPPSVSPVSLRPPPSVPAYRSRTSRCHSHGRDRDRWIGQVNGVGHLLHCDASAVMFGLQTDGENRASEALGWRRHRECKSAATVCKRCDEPALHLAVHHGGKERSIRYPGSRTDGSGELRNRREPSGSKRGEGPVETF